jgi:Bacterial archaeo-eukaryotic release factor family 7
LLRATRHSVDEVELKGVAGSLAEALRHAEPQKRLQFYARTSESQGRRPAVFHGHHPEEGAKEAIPRYFRQVDGEVGEELKGQRAPLVLAGVSYLFPI